MSVEDWLKAVVIVLVVMLIVQTFRLMDMRYDRDSARDDREFEEERTKEHWVALVKERKDRKKNTLAILRLLDDRGDE